MSFCYCWFCGYHLLISNDLCNKINVFQTSDVEGAGMHYFAVCVVRGYH